MSARIPWFFLWWVAACGDGGADLPAGIGDTGAGLGEVPDTYAFTSRFDAGSSVSFGGQTFRHVLVDDLKTHLGGLTARLNAGFFPNPGDVEAELDFYLSFDSSTSGFVPIGVRTTPPPLQETYDDLSTNKNLVEKLAGNDPVGQHADWTTEFVGWPGASSPEGLVRDWFAEIDAAAVAWSQGRIPVGPDGAPVPAVFVTADGRDLQQLTQKFLLGAVAFSQGVDDYLDDTEPGKGLLSSNAGPDGAANYTPLEHAWDEGFGYFGAAIDYPSRTDAEIAATPYADVNADGAIDLGTEVTWGHAQNAAKRDDGAVVPIDLTGQAWEGFVMGRKRITDTPGELDEAQLAELRRYRDQAVFAWEAAIAATVVHYVNEVLKDGAAFGTASYAFGDHAKHWSEMKGFALSLQFNPRSPLSDAQFVELHDLLGTAPVLPGSAGAQDADAALIAARTLLGTAYGFDLDNLGGPDGENGW